MAQSANFYIEQKTFMAEKNIVPSLEAKASDGNGVFTPRQWLERFRQFTKREHKIDITPLIKGERVKEGKLIQEDFIWGVGPEVLYQITRAEYKTEPDSIKIKDLFRLFTEYYLPKRNNLHLRRFLLGQTNGRRISRRILEKNNRIRKGKQLQHNLSQRITDIQTYDDNHRQKAARQIDEGEIIRIEKKTIELFKQNTYEKKNKKNKIPEAIISTKESMRYKKNRHKEWKDAK